jgi:hypothetical protein
MLESKCRFELNSSKQWIDIQQQLDRILTKITKDYDQTAQFHTLLQLEEFSENLTLNLNKQEHIDHLFVEARQVIESLDRSSQQSISRTIDQYETRWKDLRERLLKKLEETSKSHQFSI